MMGLGAAWTKAKGWLAGGGWGAGGVDQDLVAKETTEKSFGLLSVMNATAIRWELVSGVTGDTIDELVLTKFVPPLLDPVLVGGDALHTLVLHLVVRSLVCANDDLGNLLANTRRHAPGR